MENIRVTNITMVKLTVYIFCCLLLIVMLYLYNLDFNQNDILKRSLQIIVTLIVIFEIFFAFVNRSLFQPRFIFVFLFLVHGTIGGANILERGAFVDHYNELLHLIFYSVFTICYLSFSYSSHNIINKYTNVRLAYFFFYIGIFAMLLNWFLMGGIPIFYGEDFRFGSDSKLLLIFLIGGVSSIVIFNNGNKLPFIITIIFAIFTGYRFNPMFFIFIFIFYHLFFGNFSYRKKINIVLLAIFAFSLLNFIKFYRDIEYYGVDRFIQIAKQQGAPTNQFLLPFLPILHTVIEGPQVFQQVRDKIDDGYGYGTYYLETISTFLPGHQRSYGDIFNNITEAPTENTKTSMILGSAFIEFGVYSIIVVAFILSVFLKKIYTKAIVEQTFISRLLFLNYFIWICFWIHTGQIFSFTFITLSMLIMILKYRFTVEK